MSTVEEYRQDSRIPCRYGAKCYQKNAAHQSKYKHPPKNTKRKINVKPGPSKRVKTDSECKDEEEKKNSETEQETQLNKTEETKECKSNSSSESETKEDTKKQEVISESPSESETEEEKTENKQSKPTQEQTNNKPKDTTEPSSSKNFNPKQFIKTRFLIDMPDDFYKFWEFCQELKPNNPCDAFKDVGLKLVGAFDVLAGNFKHIKKNPEDYLRHWRYYYDTPEVQTVLKGDDKTGYHIGYFFDSPNEPPPFLVSNYGTKDGVFNKMGDNIFAAVSIYLEELKKTGDPFKKMSVSKLLASLKTKAEALKLNMSSHSAQIRARENKVVAKTFNKIGLVVPYNKKTQLGYRDLALPDKDVITLLNKLEKAAPEQKAKYLSDLQPVLTYANIALDECDFGTGVKLGWELLYHGIDSLDTTILKFLSNSYRLLNKEAFAKIAEAHLAQRKKGTDLSILLQK